MIWRWLLFVISSSSEIQGWYCHKASLPLKIIAKDDESLNCGNLWWMTNFFWHNTYLVKVIHKDCPRFEVPDTSDPGRWTNRVVNNLLYYQTNYFVSALIVFFFVRLVDIPV